MKSCLSVLLIYSGIASAVLPIITCEAQHILPPLMPWSGKSISLITKPSAEWITPAEKSSFTSTPDYRTTISWLESLCNATPLMHITGIGETANGREIKMVIASRDGDFSAEHLAASSKPLLLIQAGIHAGEIDGKDAGMMLLRDIAFSGKSALLNNVNILFIPVLNVDGHERTSPFNRVNQRGPDNMGWRTNARNLNLNRDYTKLDTEEVRAVVKVINSYSPDLYLDIHVTDGADYQYDITYGFSDTHSPAIAEWLRLRLKPHTDAELSRWGHIPGPLVFATNDTDFSAGMTEFGFSARFSNGYGDLIHLPTVLVENHSLKPFRQRVLGTYVFLEGVIRILELEGSALQNAITSDRNLRRNEVVLTWEKSSVDTITFLGIASIRKTSPVTGSEYVQWTGKPVTQRIPYFRNTKPGKRTTRPAAFLVPSAYADVIGRLKAHGIKMELIDDPKKYPARFFRIGDYKFSSRPFEGHFMVTASGTMTDREEMFYPGAVVVSTDQPLGDLAILLLHPDSPDSFFQWGFFPEIFSRTEYIEQYASEPMIAKMLSADADLRSEFALKKKNDPDFLKDPYAVYLWFYERSPYFDRNWLIYPVGIVNKQ